MVDDTAGRADDEGPPMHQRPLHPSVCIYCVFVSAIKGVGIPAVDR